MNMYSPTSQLPFFDLGLADLSLLVLHDSQKIVPVNKFTLVNKQTNFQLFLSKMYKRNRFSCKYHHLV